MTSDIHDAINLNGQSVTMNAHGLGRYGSDSISYHNHEVVFMCPDDLDEENRHYPAQCVKIFGREQIERLHIALGEFLGKAK